MCITSSFPDIDTAGDGPIGGIVELRRFEDARGRQRIALAVRSDLNLDQQVAAEGATWLDRRLVAREPADLSRAGFGAEVRAALDRRIDALAEQGLVRRDGDKVTLGREPDRYPAQPRARYSGTAPGRGNGVGAFAR